MNDLEKYQYYQNPAIAYTIQDKQKAAIAAAKIAEHYRGKAEYCYLRQMLHGFK